MFSDFVDHYNGRYYVGVSAFVKVVLKVTQTNEPRREKNVLQTQISFAVTAKLISAFVFASWVVHYLYFLNKKFQASSHLQWLCKLGLCQTWSESTMLLINIDV